MCMSDPKISIIIPVYNAEKYIEVCLKSCLEQTFGDIEIIVVNDCTPDDSMKIIKKLADADSRIIMLANEVNKGQGAARNKGINNAKGEYVLFLDSDDCLDIHACQILYDCLKKYNLEVLQFSSLDFFENAGQAKYSINRLNNPWVKNKLLNPSDKNSGLSGAPNVTPWSYITKTELIRQQKFREGVFHEDVDFTLKLFSKCKRFETVSYTGYYYRFNAESTTNTKLSVKRLMDMISVCYVLKEYVSENKYKKGYFVYDSYVDFVNNVRRTLETFDERQTLRKEIDSFYKDFKKIKSVTKPKFRTRLIPYVSRKVRQLFRG